MLNKTKKNELQKILLTSLYFFFSKFTDISVRDANETLILKIDKVLLVHDLALDKEDLSKYIN